MMPSREFLVQQSVLNAIEYLTPFYGREWLKSWKKDWLPEPFIARIRAEYRKLSILYGEAA